MSAEPLQARLVFSCPSCGLRLSADAAQAGIRGPCPSCGNEVVAPGVRPMPAPVPQGSSATGPETSLPSGGSGVSPLPVKPVMEVIPPEFSRRVSAPGSSRRRSASGRRGGHIVADSAIDRGHLEHRELMKSLFVIVVFILAIGACLIVTWLLNDQLRK